MASQDTQDSPRIRVTATDPGEDEISGDVDRTIVDHATKSTNNQLPKLPNTPADEADVEMAIVISPDIPMDTPSTVSDNELYHIPNTTPSGTAGAR